MGMLVAHLHANPFWHEWHDATYIYIRVNIHTNGRIHLSKRALSQAHRSTHFNSVCSLSSLSCPYNYEFCTSFLRPLTTFSCLNCSNCYCLTMSHYRLVDCEIFKKKFFGFIAHIFMRGNWRKTCPRTFFLDFHGRCVQLMFVMVFRIPCRFLLLIYSHFYMYWARITQSSYVTCGGLLLEIVARTKDLLVLGRWWNIERREYTRHLCTHVCIRTSSLDCLYVCELPETRKEKESSPRASEHRKKVI